MTSSQADRAIQCRECGATHRADVRCPPTDRWLISGEIVSAARAELIEQRAADPDGEISAERMERGFDVAEAMTRERIGEHPESIERTPPVSELQIRSAHLLTQTPEEIKERFAFYTLQMIDGPACPPDGLCACVEHPATIGQLTAMLRDHWVDPITHEETREAVAWLAERGYLARPFHVTEAGRRYLTEDLAWNLIDMTQEPYMPPCPANTQDAN